MGTLRVNILLSDIFLCTMQLPIIMLVHFLRPPVCVLQFLGSLTTNWNIALHMQGPQLETFLNLSFLSEST